MSKKYFFGPDLRFRDEVAVMKVESWSPFADAARPKVVGSFMGMDLMVDPILPPGQIELRSGSQRVRLVDGQVIVLPKR